MDSTEHPHRAPGSEALVRYVRRGQVLFAEPVIIVEDTDDRVITYLRAGSPMKWSTVDWAAGTIAAPADYEWHSTDVLKILEDDAWFAIWVMWGKDGGPFLGWYVDFQEPIRRSSRGIESWDLALDIVVAPDFTWRWKDEGDFARSQELGWITPDTAAMVRSAAEVVIQRIATRAAPFSEPWPSWKPDPSWHRPGLAADWATLDPVR